MGSTSAGASATRRVLVGCAVSAGASALIAALYCGGAFDPLGRLAYDFNFRLCAAPADGRIVIGALDEETIRRLAGGRVSGWTRAHQARVLRNLIQAKAEVIALDFIFSSPTAPQDDAELAAALAGCDCAILACELPPDAERIAYPLPELRDAAFACGHIHMYPSPGGVYREMKYFVTDESDAVEALALQVVYAFEGLGPDAVDWKQRRYGKHVLPPGSMAINFPMRVEGQERCYKWIPMWRLYENDFDPSEVAGKIILLGPTHHLSQDIKNTPTWTKMPGVELHAATISSILNDSFVRLTPRWKVAAVLVVLALVAGFVPAHPRAGLGTAAVAVAVPAGAVIAGSLALFVRAHVFFDWVAVVVGIVCSGATAVAYSWLLARRRATHIKSIFGRYVSKNVVDALLAGEAAVDLSGRRKRMSVLFCDIRGFTSIAENMEPAEVGRLLNRYFSEMISVVFATRGTMDKLMGDCVMAFFGDPLPAEDHAEQACRCADAILRKVREINEGRPGEKAIAVGVGVNTGEMTVGNLGAPEFVDYTVIGDNVNLASRFEGLNKLYGTQTVAGEATRDDAARAFEFRELDLVTVKGRAEPIRIFEILGPKGRVSPERLRLRDSFGEALGLYRSAEFERASELFRALADEFSDEPSRVYIVRCQEYMHNPPGPSWRGEYVATSK